MAEKKTTTSPLPQEKNEEWKPTIVVDACRFAYAAAAGALGGFVFIRWSLLAFGAGVGIGSRYAEYYGSSAKSATRASPDGEN